MVITKVNIASNAFVMLGGEIISSFVDGDVQSNIAASLYDVTLFAMLTETKWNFATKYFNLVQETLTPKGPWKYKYQLPSDCIYVIKCTAQSYEIQNYDLLTNDKEPQIEYIYQIDEINLPPYFVKALQYNLAAQFAIPLSGSIDKANYFQSLYELELKKAKNSDSSQRISEPIKSAPYIDTRR